MDKSTLSQYGWVVICIIVLTILIALATPFGTFVKDSAMATLTATQTIKPIQQLVKHNTPELAATPMEVTGDSSILYYNSAPVLYADLPAAVNSATEEAETEFFIYPGLYKYGHWDQAIVLEDGYTYTIDKNSSNQYSTGSVVHITAPDGSTFDCIYVVLGDINGDSAIDTKDTIAVNLAFAKNLESGGITTTAQALACDVNLDGVIDRSDYDIIRGFAQCTLSFTEVIEQARGAIVEKQVLA